MAEKNNKSKTRQVSMGGKIITLTEKEYEDMQKNLKSTTQIKQERAKAAEDKISRAAKGGTATGGASNVSTPATNSQPNANWKNPEYVKSYIATRGQQLGLTPDEIKFAIAIAAKESGFNINAHNTGTKKIPENSWGVFQINTDVHKDYTGKLDPVQNIDYGLKFAQAKFRQAKGNPRLAARMYNGSGSRAEDYANVFMRDFYPKYTNDFNEGKIAMLDGSQPIPSMDLDTKRQSEIDRYSENYNTALANTRLPYNWDAANQAVKNLTDIYNEGLNYVNANFPQLTEAQKQAVVSQYLQENEQARQFVQNNIATIQQASSREQTVDPMIEQYNQISRQNLQDLQAANPYTRLAQNAPITDLQEIDINSLKAAQRDSQRAAINSFLSGKTGAPDYAALELQRAQQLDQAARYNQAVRNAQVTGLPIDYFLSGAGMDYNALNQTQQQELRNMQDLNKLYAMYIQPQAAAQIAGMVNNANTTSATNLATAQKAIDDAEKNRQNNIKMLLEYNKGFRDNIGGIYQQGISGESSTNVANINAGANIYGTNERESTARINKMDEVAQKEASDAQNYALKLQEAQQGGVTGGLTPSNYLTGSGQFMTAGMLLNNPKLINAGVAQTFKMMGYSDDQIASLLGGNGQGGVTPMPNYGQVGFIPPMYNQQPQQ